MGYTLTPRSAEPPPHRDTTPIARFDPRFWTVNFPRPMMASVVTDGADALTVDATFYHSDELAGLIWESEDRLDHPLLAYATDRDYSGLTWTFHWRSAGVKPLDAVHGPTLTIEGRDAAGHPRAWYVRLWNYATGTPTDARIEIAFDRLNGGFLLPQEADPVHVADIDRMFISVVPEAYDGAGARLPEPAIARVEMRAIATDGAGAMLACGDAMLPENDCSMATAYDDSFNQTPERLLRQIRALGYRGGINHYLGMSHYFRLESAGDAGLYVSLSTPHPGEQFAAINQPCAAWHRDFLTRAAAMGFSVIQSLSYELFDAHCWNDWKQRAENGDPALTGWEPPSALLSPAHAGAMAYLQAVARAFVALARDADVPIRFQVGEPWWWIMPEQDGVKRICLYDAAARAAFGTASVSIPDIAGPKTPAQIAMLDRAGELLAASTAALVAAARAEAGAAGIETLLLAYLPTVLDTHAPEAKRANLPTGWAAPAFDTLQLEDYDWVIAGDAGATARGVALATERLGYPGQEQHYFAGFALRAEDRFIWRHMARAIEDARGRNAREIYVWALPQVARDGFTYFAEKEGQVAPFDDVRFPLAIGRRASVSPAFSTNIVTGVSGAERRNADWADARAEYDAGPGVRSEAEARELLAFFRARRGAAKGFRFRDPFDHDSTDGAGDGNSAPAATDQPIGVGDGRRTGFDLVKTYGDPDDEDAQVRRITRPVEGSVLVAVDGVPTGGWTLGSGGEVRFDAPPAIGARVTAGFAFDVPVRFASDRLEIAGATHGAADMAEVRLVEIKEA